MKALLSNNKVVELSADPERYYHPTIAAEFVTVPANTQVGQVKKGNKFVDDELPIPAIEPENPTED